MSDNILQKPKNEFDKPKNTPDQSAGMYRERGGCLTVFLVLLIGWTAYYLVDTISKLLGANNRFLLESSLMPLIAVALVVNVAILIFAVALWKWKRWGYYGLLALNLIQAVVMLLLGNIFGVVAAAVNLAVLNSVYTGRIEMFE